MDLPEGKLAAWHVLNWENEGTSSTNQGLSCAMFDYRRVLSLEVFRMGPGCFFAKGSKEITPVAGQICWQVSEQLIIHAGPHITRCIYDVIG